MEGLKQLHIPVTEREKYIGSGGRTEIVTDSRGTKQIVWPGALDIPTKLLLDISPEGHVGSITCSYLKDLGFSTSHHLAANRFFMRIFDLRGVVHRFGFVSPIMAGPGTYEKFLELFGRINDCVRFLPDGNIMKWKLIFTTGLLRKEWEKGEAVLRPLLANRSALLSASPYR